MKFQSSQSQVIKFRILLISLILFAILGYLAFSYFIVKVVPGTFPLSLFVIAIVAGIAAFFNPCSLAFLPAYVIEIFLEKKRGQEKQVKKIKKKKTKEINLYYLFLAALGLITFNLILGAILGLLGEGFIKSFSLAHPFVRILRGVVGIILLFLGLMYFSGKGFHLLFLEKASRKFQNIKAKSLGLAMFSYGFGYNLIGIGCTAPILAFVALTAFSSFGFATALFTFLIYSFTMAFMMFLVSLLSMHAKEAAINKLRTSLGRIRKVSGLILIFAALLLTISSLYPQEVSRLFNELVPKFLIGR